MFKLVDAARYEFKEDQNVYLLVIRNKVTGHYTVRVTRSRPFERSRDLYKWGRLVRNKPNRGDDDVNLSLLPRTFLEVCKCTTNPDFEVLVVDPFNLEYLRSISNPVERERVKTKYVSTLAVVEAYTFILLTLGLHLYCYEHDKGQAHTPYHDGRKFYLNKKHYSDIVRFYGVL